MSLRWLKHQTMSANKNGLPREAAEFLVRMEFSRLGLKIDSLDRFFGCAEQPQFENASRNVSMSNFARSAKLHHASHSAHAAHAAAHVWHGWGVFLWRVDDGGFCR